MLIELHVEERGYPKRIEECIRNPPMQTERKYSKICYNHMCISLLSIAGKMVANIFFLDSTVLALDYYISMFMIGLNHRFMHAR